MIVFNNVSEQSERLPLQHVFLDSAILMKLSQESVPLRLLRLFLIYLCFLLKHLYDASVHIHALC